MRDELGIPIPIKIRTKAEVYDAEPELRVRGQWVCLSIEPSCPWPTRAQKLSFAGHDLWIIPLTQEEHGGVAMLRTSTKSVEEAESLLYRFLSVLAWREEYGIAVAHRTGGSMPCMMGLNHKSGFTIREAFDFTDMICPDVVDHRIALALVREARGLNHHGYAFLSYWRVLELAFGTASERVSWMKTTLPTLRGAGVQEAKNSITAQGVADISAHLFQSGRCAIAHATAKPLINPDDPRDAARLYRELPLVREMAVRAIEERFGISSKMTEYRRHLYELRGWKSVLGEAALSALSAGLAPSVTYCFDLPLINVRLRDQRPYKPFERMVPKSVMENGGGLAMVYGTADDLLEFRFTLATSVERLQFDIFDGIYGRDDGSVSAAEYQAELKRFQRDYFSTACSRCGTRTPGNCCHGWMRFSQLT